MIFLWCAHGVLVKCLLDAIIRLEVSVFLENGTRNISVIPEDPFLFKSQDNYPLQSDINIHF